MRTLASLVLVFTSAVGGVGALGASAPPIPAPPAPIAQTDIETVGVPGMNDVKCGIYRILDHRKFLAVCGR